MENRKFRGGSGRLNYLNPKLRKKTLLKRSGKRAEIVYRKMYKKQMEKRASVRYVKNALFYKVLQIPGSR